MTEKEKIVEVLRDNIEYELRDYPNDHYVGVTFNYEAMADALLEAQIGDVTKWKHRAEVAEERLKKLKKTEGDLTVEEEINILENLLEEAKHRSFVFERELVKYKKAFDNTIKAFHETVSAFFPDEEIDLDKWKKQNLANAEKELAEEGKYEKY